MLDDKKRNAILEELTHYLSIPSTVGFIRELQRDFPCLSFDNVLNNLEDAVTKFGVTVTYSTRTEFEKYINEYSHLYPDDNNPELVIDESASPEEKRYLIAYHLGHLVTTLEWVPIRYNPTPFDTIRPVPEHQYGLFSLNRKTCQLRAEHFAAELLAPIEKVSAFLKTYQLNHTKEEQIHALSNYFNIPEHLATKRWELAQKHLETSEE